MRFLDDIQYRLPPPLRAALPHRDKIDEVAKNVAKALEESLDRIGKEPLQNDPRAFEDHRGYVLWHDCFEYYLYANRIKDGLTLSGQLYGYLLTLQEKLRLRLHKGDTLWLTHMLYDQADFPWHTVRFRMLAVMEDALTHQSAENPANPSKEKFGLTERYEDYAASYSFLRYELGLTDEDIGTLFAKIRDFSKTRTGWGTGLDRYPEPLLSQLGSIDRDLFERISRTIVSPKDHGQYIYNKHYVNELYNKLDSSRDGMVLEELALYLMSCVPGTRSLHNLKAKDAQHDVYGSFEGYPPDFRSDVGRYFICECKSWTEAVDVQTLNSFAKRMDSAKVSFGVLFSRKGLTGVKRNTDATLARCKFFSEKEKVIAVIDEHDLEDLATKANMSFFDMLRREYEEVKFDVPVAHRK